MKTQKTREETLADLAARSSEGATAAKRFAALAKRIVNTPASEVNRRAAEWKEARKPTSTES